MPERRRTGSADVLAGLLAAVLVGLLSAPGAAAADTTGSAVDRCHPVNRDDRAPEAPAACVAFRFADASIIESSGLVITGEHAVTVNDSGDTGRVFTVDPETGETVGVTSWAGDPVDVEALAPAGPGHVWVADIGDNDAEREQIAVLRVPVGPGMRTVVPERYRLAHPGGPVDAEALLADPRTGRLLVASKQFLGGRLLVAPRRLDPEGVNRLRPVGDVVGLATGGAFLDAEHLLLRTYAGAHVYRMPGPGARLQAVASFPLPEQEQGEAVAVGEQGRLFLSSEGAAAPVLRVRLPAEVRRLLAESAPEPASPADETAPAPRDADGGTAEPAPWPFVAGTLLAVVAGLVLLRSLRPR